MFETSCMQYIQVWDTLCTLHNISMFVEIVDIGEWVLISCGNIGALQLQKYTVCPDKFVIKNEQKLGINEKLKLVPLTL